MRIAIDFHVHTALSPCGDDDMTPNNVINMCLLKELDAIAITDHNSVENCKACIDIGKDKDLIVIPGMELQTKEEVHLICLFKELAWAIDFQKLVYGRLTKEKNNKKIFGRQLVMNEKDQIVEENERMLISSAKISINEAFNEVSRRQGIVIPAHIDKSAYSLIANLGFVPKTLPIKTLEVSKRCDIEKFLSKHENLKKYQIIRSSDAHYLWDIIERTNFIDVEEKSIHGIFNVL